MLEITRKIVIPDHEIEIQAVRAQGAGGQNVNKLATAIHLRFDIAASSLPELYKQRLLRLADRRINKQGIIVIKSQQFRSQEQNRQAALQRLAALIRQAGHAPRPRISTRVPRSVRQQRMNQKNRRGRLKALRTKVKPDHE